jgi:hypothetical protein
MKTVPVKAIRYFRLVMPVFYILVGTLLLFTGFLAEQVGKYGRAAGGLMVIYGIFRIYRTIKDNSKMESDETAN